MHEGADVGRRSHHGGVIDTRRSARTVHVCRRTVSVHHEVFASCADAQVSDGRRLDHERAAARAHEHRIGGRAGVPDGEGEGVGGVLSKGESTTTTHARPAVGEGGANYSICSDESCRRCRWIQAQGSRIEHNTAIAERCGRSSDSITPQGACTFFGQCEAGARDGRDQL